MGPTGRRRTAQHTHCNMVVRSPTRGVEHRSTCSAPPSSSTTFSSCARSTKSPPRTCVCVRARGAHVCVRACASLHARVRVCRRDLDATRAQGIVHGLVATVVRTAVGLQACTLRGAHARLKRVVESLTAILWRGLRPAWLDVSRYASLTCIPEWGQAKGLTIQRLDASARP